MTKGDGEHPTGIQITTIRGTTDGQTPGTSGTTGIHGTIQGATIGPTPGITETTGIPVGTTGGPTSEPMTRDTPEVDTTDGGTGTDRMRTARGTTIGEATGAITKVTVIREGTTIETTIGGTDIAQVITSSRGSRR